MRGSGRLARRCSCSSFGSADQHQTGLRAGCNAGLPPDSLRDHLHHGGQALGRRLGLHEPFEGRAALVGQRFCHPGVQLCLGRFQCQRRQQSSVPSLVLRNGCLLAVPDRARRDCHLAFLRACEHGLGVSSPPALLLVLAMLVPVAGDRPALGFHYASVAGAYDGHLLLRLQRLLLRAALLAVRVRRPQHAGLHLEPHLCLRALLRCRRAPAPAHLAPPHGRPAPPGDRRPLLRGVAPAAPGVPRLQALERDSMLRAWRVRVPLHGGPLPHGCLVPPIQFHWGADGPGHLCGYAAHNPVGDLAGRGRARLRHVPGAAPARLLRLLRRLHPLCPSVACATCGAGQAGARATSGAEGPGAVARGPLGAPRAASRAGPDVRRHRGPAARGGCAAAAANPSGAGAIRGMRAARGGQQVR
mmetsp:Transcript_111883/g.311415  ORF Transcript_111883/g.311415 Transcript_111883/m.311415 type:complete len:415 (+) Transcript_111883:372-1616(+)